MQGEPPNASPEEPSTAAARSAVALSIARWERASGALPGTVLGKVDATDPRAHPGPHPAPPAPGAAALLARLLACTPSGKGPAGLGPGAGSGSEGELGATAESQLAAAAAGEAAQTLLYTLLRQGFRRRGAPAAKPGANPDPAPERSAGAGALGRGHSLEQGGPPAGADGGAPGSVNPQRGSGDFSGQGRAPQARGHAAVRVAERLAEARRALAAAAVMLPGAAAAPDAARSPDGDPNQGLIRVHASVVGALAARAYVLCQGRPAAALALLAASVLLPPPSTPAGNPSASQSPCGGRRYNGSPSSSPVRSRASGAGGLTASGSTHSSSDNGKVRAKCSQRPEAPDPAPGPASGKASPGSGSRAAAALEQASPGVVLGSGGTGPGPKAGPTQAAPKGGWAALVAGEQPLAGAAAVRGAFAALLAPPGKHAR